jgi:hypothetical protein
MRISFRIALDERPNIHTKGAVARAIIAMGGATVTAKRSAWASAICGHQLAHDQAGKSGDAQHQHAGQTIGIGKRNAQTRQPSATGPDRLARKRRP